MNLAPILGEGIRLDCTGPANWLLLLPIVSYLWAKSRCPAPPSGTAKAVGGFWFMLLAPPAAILANVVGSHVSIPVTLAVFLKIEGSIAVRRSLLHGGRTAEYR